MEKYFEENQVTTSKKKHFFKERWQIIATPCLLLLIVMVIHSIYHLYFLNTIELTQYGDSFNLVENTIYYVLISFCIWWLVMRLLSNYVFMFFRQTQVVSGNRVFQIIFPFFTVALKMVLSLVALNILTKQLNLPGDMSYYIHKTSNILIIIVIGALFFKLVGTTEALLLNQYDGKINGTNKERKIYTQTLILKRVAYTIISITTVGAILLLFENGKILGTSVLTTAGFMGLVITFTAQRSLASIFSGIEIAISQSIKIGDSVIVDGEAGTIEEINFRHVIVKLWDWRRMIVPTNYFLDKPFQNCSIKQKNNLIGTVDLYADFTLPVFKVREQLKNILSKSPCWDTNIGQLEVNDLHERSMKLRIFASARNAEELNDLCAEIREKIIAYIVENHTDCLPKTRSVSIKNDTPLMQ